MMDTIKGLTMYTINNEKCLIVRILVKSSIEINDKMIYSYVPPVYRVTKEMITRTSFKSERSILKHIFYEYGKAVSSVSAKSETI